MKKLDQNREEINSFLEKQTSLFYKLLDDVENKRLKKGISKTDIIHAYGEPIFSENIDNDPLIEEMLFYRHPTEFFSSDRVYLYFNRNQELIMWKYNSAKEYN